MMPMAVSPIARPIKARRSVDAPSNDWWTGELGCSNSTTKAHAETMNVPSAAASIRYSGQCCENASLGAIVCISSRLRNVPELAGYSRNKPERFRILIGEMVRDTCKELVQVNIGWLQQALTLMDRMDDKIFSTCPLGLAPHKVGSHLRHVLEFYQCFLDGIATSRIDYDARKRDESIELRRRSATTSILSVISRLEEVLSLGGDWELAVRVENADDDVYLISSVGRELQALSSHTIHHFALIAITLKAHGLEVDRDFGMSPSTLRYQASRLVLASV
jgi:hypothetical protein